MPPKKAQAGSKAKAGDKSKAASRPSPAALEPDGKPWFSVSEVKQIGESLLAWYDANHRVLPWRRTPHSKRPPAAPESAEQPAPPSLPPQQFAYWVWVSEVMLQQTQVATVIPYFRRWTAKWPRVTDLAGASIEQVNEMWAGLGYYRRARYLLEGAKYVAEKLDGSFPTTAKELLQIPGVGAYTSAAVSSIAFGAQSAVVDGNVVRVMSRLRALAGPPEKLGPAHAAMATEALHLERPGDYNQAVMELGATVCRPLNPSCAECPVSASCRAVGAWQRYLAEGGTPDVEDAPRVTQYPSKKEVKGKREQRVAVCVLEVICTQQDQQHQRAAREPAAAAVAGQGGPSAPANNGSALGTAAPPGSRKRQRTMEDFMLLAAAAKKQAAAGAGAARPAGQSACGSASGHAASPGKQAQLEPDAAAGEAGEACGAAASGLLAKLDLSALAATGVRHYLLAQRPEGGLLAGLWEFPGVVLEDVAAADATDAAAAKPPPWSDRQRSLDQRLGELLGPKLGLRNQDAGRPSGDGGGKAAGAKASGRGGKPAAQGGGGTCVAAAWDSSAEEGVRALQVLGRYDMGSYVHVFSHIRQTNYVERLTAVFDGTPSELAGLMGASLELGTGQGGAGGGGGTAAGMAAKAAARCGSAAAAARPGAVSDAAGGGGGAEDEQVIELGSSSGSDEGEGGDSDDGRGKHAGKGRQRGGKAGEARSGKATRKPVAKAAAKGPADRQQKARPGRPQLQAPQQQQPLPAAPALKWVAGPCMREVGLSSGVRRIFGLATGIK